MHLLTINLDTEKDLSASFTIGRDGKNLLRELQAWFHPKAIYISLHRWGDSRVFVTCYNRSNAVLGQLGWW
jgi:hypothetical protein